jgi:hypothetical protein
MTAGDLLKAYFALKASSRQGAISAAPCAAPAREAA